MKKLLILLTISSLGFLACNNAANEESTEVSSDSSVIEPSLGNPPVNPADTMINADTTPAATDSSITL
ncbi:MAG: hypothetical protein QM594_03305 [Niabella sp.]